MSYQPKEMTALTPSPPPAAGGCTRVRSMRAAMTAALLLAVAAVTMTMTACEPATPATSGGGAGDTGWRPQGAGNRVGAR